MSTGMSPGKSPGVSATAPALRIGVAGAGAIGCTLAALLARAGGDVHVLTRGRSLAALRRDGVVLHRQGQQIQRPLHASDDARELGVQDVLFLCAKSQDMSALLRSALPMVGPNTMVIPLVNGVPWWFFLGLPGVFSGRVVQAVDPRGELVDMLPASQLIGAVVFITAERLAPGQAMSDNPLLMVLGEIDASPPREQLRELTALLMSAGVEARCTETIRDTLWTKILANLTSNPLSVICGAVLAEIYSNEHLLALVREMLQEGLALSAAYGARMAFSPAIFVAEGAAMGAVRTSMLQDHLAGRTLELAAIGDAVLELAQLQGIAMPTTRRVLGLANFIARRQDFAIQEHCSTGAGVGSHQGADRKGSS